MALGIVGAIVGEIRMYAGGAGVVPDGTAQEVEAGWLLCNGAIAVRTAYPDLYAKIGIAFGNGDGSGTTFTLPNLVQRFPFGRAASGVGNALGAVGGETFHTLLTSEMPAHTHSVTGATDSSGSHTHPLNVTSAPESVAHTHIVSYQANGPSAFMPNTDFPGGALAFFYLTSGSFNTGPESVTHVHTISGSSDLGGAHSHAITGTASSVGSGTAHNNMPPYQTVHFIVKY